MPNVALGARACRIRVRAARAGRAARGRPDGPGPGASRGEQEAPEDVRAARRPHPMSSETREDRARRRREERASTVLDGARERGPTDGEPGDVRPSSHVGCSAVDRPRAPQAVHEVDDDDARDAFGPLEAPRDALVRRTRPGRPRADLSIHFHFVKSPPKAILNLDHTAIWVILGSK